MVRLTDRSEPDMRKRHRKNESLAGNVKLGLALAQNVENDTIDINNNKNSMLGELIYESTGKIVSQKAVDTGDINNPSAKVEFILW